MVMQPNDQDSSAARLSPHRPVLTVWSSRTIEDGPGDGFDLDEVVLNGSDPQHIFGGGDDGVKTLALADVALESLQTKRAIAL